MNLGELREATMENIVRDDLENERLNRYINIAQQRIARYHNWRDLYVKANTTTVPGQGNYALPLGDDRLKDLVSITLIDPSGQDTKLVAVPYRRLHELVPNPDSETQGKPKVYTLWDNAIQLYPIPETEYTVQILYVKWPTKLEDTLDESDFIGLDDVIIAGATQTGFMSLQQKEETIFWNQQFSVLLQEAMSGDIKHTDHILRLQGYRSTPPRFSDIQPDPMAQG